MIDDPHREHREKEEALKARLGCGFIILALVSALAWGHVMYGDWRCGFVSCRVVIDSGASR